MKLLRVRLISNKKGIKMKILKAEKNKNTISHLIEHYNLVRDEYDEYRSSRDQRKGILPTKEEFKSHLHLILGKQKI
jgi:hypothetical protein